MLSQGEDGYKPTSLTAGTSYYVLAFGVQYGGDDGRYAP